MPPVLSIRTFKGWVRVLAQKPTGGSYQLGADREIIFIVPPEPWSSRPRSRALDAALGAGLVTPAR